MPNGAMPFAKQGRWSDGRPQAHGNRPGEGRARDRRTWRVLDGLGIRGSEAWHVVEKALADAHAAGRADAQRGADDELAALLSALADLAESWEVASLESPQPPAIEILAGGAAKLRQIIALTPMPIAKLPGGA